MVLICSTKCAKILLVIFNVLFWISGCVLISLGSCMVTNPGKAHLYRVVAAKIDSDDFEKVNYIAKDGINYIAYSLVAIGGFIVLVGFIGCCGALQDSKCVMVVYFICLFLIMCAELAVAVITMIYREQILGGLQNRMTLTMKKFYAQDTAFTNSLDYAQFTFECCGTRGGSDYMNSKWKNDTNTSNKNVPLTCCALSNRNNEDAWLNPQPIDEVSCQGGELAELLILGHAIYSRHNKGCFESLDTWFKRDSAYLVASGVSTATLEVFGMVFSVCLCRNIGDMV